MRLIYIYVDLFFSLLFSFAEFFFGGDICFRSEIIFSVLFSLWINPSKTFFNSVTVLDL